MAIAILGRRHYSASKPHGGARVDFGHPLAQGLVTCIPLLEAQGGISDLVRREGVTEGKPVWTAGQRGAGISPTNDNGPYLNFDPFVGLASMSIFSAFEITGARSASHNWGGIGVWQIGATSILIRSESSTTTRAIIAFSGGNIDTGGRTDSYVVGNNSIAVVVASASLTLWCNAVQIGAPVAGSGTKTAMPATPYWVYSGDGSLDGIAPHIGQAVYGWDRALTRDEIAWLHAEPFAFLSPAVARTYFDLGATGVPKHFMHYARLRRAS